MKHINKFVYFLYFNKREKEENSIIRQLQCGDGEHLADQYLALL